MEAATQVRFICNTDEILPPYTYEHFLQRTRPSTSPPKYAQSKARFEERKRSKLLRDLERHATKMAKRLEDTRPYYDRNDWCRDAEKQRGYLRLACDTITSEELN